LICYSWASPVQEAFSNLAEENSTAAQISEQVIEQTPTAFDELIIFLFLGMVIGLMVAAVRTDFSPVVIFIFLLMVIISVLVASGLVNIYQGFAQAPGISEVAANLTFANVVFSRYTPLFICIIAAVILILMYSKSGSDISV
jgi:hypothetical protein